MRDFTENCIQYIRTNVQIGGTRDKNRLDFRTAGKKGRFPCFCQTLRNLLQRLIPFCPLLYEGQYNRRGRRQFSRLKAFEQLHKLRKNDAFKSWLFQITANECKKLLKQKSIYLSDASWQEPAAAEDGYLTPEIQDELSQLSEPERRVITLSVFGGYTSREIAGILKKREGSIRSIKSRALAKLREKNADL